MASTLCDRPDRRGPERARYSVLPPAAEASVVPHDLGGSSGMRSKPVNFSILLRNRVGSDQQLHRPGPRR